MEKRLLAEATQCFHLEFHLEGPHQFDFLPGQFISCVAMDGRGKEQTRAYSLASAPGGISGCNGFALCVNRVDGGFFSNLLCDLAPGEIVYFHGPHGLFLLHEPVEDGVFLAGDTGIAPIRSFVQWLFPEGAAERSSGRRFDLFHEVAHPTAAYYREEFEQQAAKSARFRYSTEGAAEALKAAGSAPRRQVDLNKFLGEMRANSAQGSDAPAQAEADAATSRIPHAYVCGLRSFVAPARKLLAEHGWEKASITFERYD